MKVNCLGMNQSHKAGWYLELSWTFGCQNIGKHWANFLMNKLKLLSKSLEILFGTITVGSIKKKKEFKTTRRNVQHRTEIWDVSKYHKKLEPSCVHFYHLLQFFLNIILLQKSVLNLNKQPHENERKHVYNLPPRSRQRIPSMSLLTMSLFNVLTFYST